MRNNKIHRNGFYQKFYHSLKGLKVRKLMIVMGLMVVSACSGTDKYSVKESVREDNVMSIRAVEISDKVKRRKFDILVQMESLHDKPIVFFMNQMGCYKGNERGYINHAFFGAGERIINLASGQMKQFRFVCSFASPIEGKNFRLTTGKVFANSSGDGRSQDKELSSGLDLVINIGKKT